MSGKPLFHRTKPHVKDMSDTTTPLLSDSAIDKRCEAMLRILKYEKGYSHAQASKVFRGYQNGLVEARDQYEPEYQRLLAEISFVKENAAAWERNAKDGWAAQEAASKREDAALAENAALRERLAVLEGQGVEPFNGHTPLPWDIGESNYADDDRLGIRSDDWVVADIHLDANFDQAGTKEGRANAAFIVQACNAYYPTQSSLRSLRAAAQVAADAGVAVIQKMWEANDMAVLGERPSNSWHVEIGRAHV
jgi:hypothetical protein